MTRHVVQFSGGTGSWATARRVADTHGTENLVLLFADTLAEDPDLYRFLDQAAADIGAPVTRVCDGRTPEQVDMDRRWLSNARVAQCSMELKIKPCRQWLEANCDPASTVLYVGIDWSETHRTPGIVKGWEPWRVEFPLTEPPYTSKGQIEDDLRARGIEMPRLNRLGFPHNNCLHPDTRFITDRGIKTLRECVGTSVRVLGRGGGWRDAEIRSFGEQELWEIRLRRYGDEQTLLATADHLWPVRKAPGRTDYRFASTAALTVGQRIAGMYGQVARNVTPSAVGIAAGFTFGDGTAPNPATGQVPPAHAYFCGEKDQALMPYFAACRTSTRADGVVVVHDLPRSWKQRPDLGESQSYLYGWLAGYFAADGSYSGGHAKLSSARREALEFVRDLCARIGISTGPIRENRRIGYGAAESSLYSVALHVSTLRADFFVVPEHLRRFETRPESTPRPADWQVTEVRRTGHTEEVMCAVVPDGNVFTLDGNVLTHNCGGACVRGGQAQWVQLLRTFPERYAAKEAHEQRMRDLLGADVSILKDRTGGQTKTLPLTVLRQRVENPAQGDLFDDLDWGGCGCLTDFGAAA